MKKFVEPIIGVAFNPVIFECLVNLPDKKEARSLTLDYMRGCWAPHECNWCQRKVMFL